MHLADGGNMGDGDAQPPAGWFEAPDQPGYQRYWNGHEWTEHRRRSEQPAPPEVASKDGGRFSKWILVALFVLLALAAIGDQIEDNQPDFECENASLRFEASLGVPVQVVRAQPDVEVWFAASPLGGIWVIFNSDPTQDGVSPTEMVVPLDAGARQLSSRGRAIPEDAPFLSGITDNHRAARAARSCVE